MGYSLNMLEQGENGNPLYRSGSSTNDSTL